MTLATVDLEDLRVKLRRAAEAELPLVEHLRRQVARLRIEPIFERAVPTIAAVATDGGQNHLAIDPLHVELLRVVDSRGIEHLLEIVPLSGALDDLATVVAGIAPMQRMLERLRLPYHRLSRFLPGAGVDVRRDHLATLRDIVEWAVILDMAWDQELPHRVVLRDGLLRTLAFEDEARRRLHESFEAAFQATGRLLAGVAKRSQVLNYLSLAIALDGTFAVVGACYAGVPLDIERVAYRRYPEWADQHLGRLHLAKLGPHADSPVFPVDVPAWLLDRRAELFEYLAATAMDSFPIPGYPQPLQEAHDHASIGGLEFSVLGDQLMEAVVDAFPPDRADELVAHVTIGRALQQGARR